MASPPYVRGPSQQNPGYPPQALRSPPQVVRVVAAGTPRAVSGCLFSSQSALCLSGAALASPPGSARNSLRLVQPVVAPNLKARSASASGRSPSPAPGQLVSRPNAVPSAPSTAVRTPASACRPTAADAHSSPCQGLRQWAPSPRVMSSSPVRASSSTKGSAVCPTAAAVAAAVGCHAQAGRERGPTMPVAVPSAGNSSSCTMSPEGVIASAHEFVATDDYCSLKQRPTSYSSSCLKSSRNLVLLQEGPRTTGELLTTDPLVSTSARRCSASSCSPSAVTSVGREDGYCGGALAASEEETFRSHLLHSVEAMQRLQHEVHPRPPATSLHDPEANLGVVGMAAAAVSAASAAVAAAAAAAGVPPSCPTELQANGAAHMMEHDAATIALGTEPMRRVPLSSSTTAPPSVGDATSPLPSSVPSAASLSGSPTQLMLSTTWLSESAISGIPSISPRTPVLTSPVLQTAGNPMTVEAAALPPVPARRPPVIPQEDNGMVLRESGSCSSLSRASTEAVHTTGLRPVIDCAIPPNLMPRRLAARLDAESSTPAQLVAGAIFSAESGFQQDGQPLETARHQQLLGEVSSLREEAAEWQRMSKQREGELLERLQETVAAKDETDDELARMKRQLAEAQDRLSELERMMQQQDRSVVSERGEIDDLASRYRIVERERLAFKQLWEEAKQELNKVRTEANQIKTEQQVKAEPQEVQAVANQVKSDQEATVNPAPRRPVGARGHGMSSSSSASSLTTHKLLPPSPKCSPPGNRRTLPAASSSGSCQGGRSGKAATTSSLLTNNRAATTGNRSLCHSSRGAPSKTTGLSGGTAKSDLSVGTAKGESTTSSTSSPTAGFRETKYN